MSATDRAQKRQDGGDERRQPKDSTKDDGDEEEAQALTAAKAPDEAPQELIGAFGVRFAEGGTLEIQPASRDATSGQRHHNANSNSITTSTTLPVPPPLHDVCVAAAVAVDEQEEAQRLRDAAEKGRQQVLSTAVNAEVVAPQQLFTKEYLRMPRLDNELRFQAEHNHLFLSALRIVRPVAMGMNASFFLWELLVMQHEPDPPILACFLVKAITLCVFYALTRVAETQNPRLVQPAMCLANLTIVVQLSTTMFLLPDGFVIAAGGFGFILLPGSANLRFWYALAFCSASLVVSNALAVASRFWNSSSEQYELYFVLVHLNMFTVPYCVFGMVLSYVVELHLRLRFRDSGTIFSWADPQQQQQQATEDGAHQQQQESALLVGGGEQNPGPEDDHPCSEC